MSGNELYIQGNQDLKVPAHMNLGKYILQQLKKKDNEVALENYETQEKTTYKEYTQQSINFAQALLKLGVKKGDIVALGYEKCNIISAISLGVIYTGAVYTPHDIDSGRSVLKHKLSVVKPKYFILSKSFWNLYGDLLRSIDSIETFITLDEAWNQEKMSKFVTIQRKIESLDTNLFEPISVNGETDTALILYSSGTTGMPKGVRLSHLSCILISSPEDFQDKELQTVHICGLWYYNYDIFSTFKFLLCGKKIVYTNDIGIDKILKCVEHYKANLTMLVPYLILDIIKADLENYNLDSLKTIYSRSGPLHSKTIEIVKQRLPRLENVFQGYGMTECGELSSENWANNGSKAGSVGMVTPGLTLKIVCPKTDNLLSPNQYGEIRVRGPNIMQGYMGLSHESYLDKEGFFKTGDLGYYDEDQYIFIVDRIKEVLSYRGHKIAPIELEAILQQHPGVLEVAVVGLVDPVDGDLPAAFIVKKNDNVTPEEITEYLKKEVPPHMQLHGGIKFIDKIPRNARGKTLRRELRAMLN